MTVKTIEASVKENKAKVRQRLKEDVDLPCPLQEEIISYDHLDAADDLDRMVSGLSGYGRVVGIGCYVLDNHRQICYLEAGRVSCKEKCRAYQIVQRSLTEPADREKSQVDLKHGE
ncbi:MAG: hypothetical protein HY363_03180 [Candidatus Aenigmarchaeota archaeon]|nr:hypothetical protein [Candidatus Aenigmarchaeota archaeon]